MNNENNITAAELIRYKVPDPLQDFAFEVSDVLEIPFQNAMDLANFTIDYAKPDSTVQYLDNLDYAVYTFVRFVTQPFRAPFMLNRMDHLIIELSKYKNIKSVLDYGGGGGKDSIIFCRLNFDVTYSDFPASLVAMVEKRFSLRGLKNIKFADVRHLPDTRFDVINCMDVIEHVYDVEFIVADLLARTQLGGHLLCYPAFFTSWNGDHIEKNCGYGSYFIQMIEKMGFRLITKRPNTSFVEKILHFFRIGWLLYPPLHFIRERPIKESIEEERHEIRRELYKVSQKLSIITSLISAVYLPFAYIFSKLLIGEENRRKGRVVVELIFSNVVDNISVWRLSKHRLKQPEKALPTYF